MLPQIVALVIVEKSFNAQLPTSYMGNSITPVFCTTFEINQRASSYSLVEFQYTEQMIHYVSFAPVGRKSIQDWSKLEYILNTGESLFVVSFLKSIS